MSNPDAGHPGASHPSAEEVAEHLEGLLAAEAGRRVGEHLRTCAECSGMARNLAAVPDTLRAAAAAPTPVPEHVSDRVQAAIAAETAQSDEPGSPVSLQDRRARRRRLVGSGLLAAAAATVVAVGLGQMLQGGGAGQASRAGGQAGVTSLQQGQRAQQHPGPRQERTGATPQDVLGDVAGLRATDAPRPFAALVRGVAAAHTPGASQHDRGRCVTAVLGRAAARTGAAYAVPLPAPLRGEPGVVVLRPAEAPTRAVLVACAPQPRVLLRGPLPG